MSLNVELLEQSFEKIKPHADEFAASFYEHLFENHSEMKPLFANTDMVNQQKKLLSSLVMVVENLRNLEDLEPVLNALGSRHVGYGAIPRYYGPFGEALLLTFEQYLQEDWTPELKKAWLDTYTAITTLLLKVIEKESAPNVVPAEKNDSLPKSAPDELETATLAKDSTSKSELPEKSQEVQTIVEPEKKTLISVQLDSKTLQELIKNFIVSYQQIQTKIFEQPLGEVLKQIPQKLINAFWRSPTWLVTIVSAILFTAIVVVVDTDSLLGKAFNAAESISLVVALVLFIKETPDRRKQFHYQAWSMIDAAHDVKVSYARFLALQDLNEDDVSLRGLEASGAELVAINLSHANLSQANLMESDLSNANLSYANLDNANLAQAKLSGANLSYAKLGFAQLSQANLNSTNLRGANLSCADLSHANLSGADLRDASLSGANLEGAYLTGANLKNANVSDYELSSAFIEGVILPDGSRHKSENL